MPHAKARGIMRAGGPGLERTVQVVMVRCGTVHDLVACGAATPPEQTAALRSRRWAAITRSSPVLRAIACIANRVSDQQRVLDARDLRHDGEAEG
ncbi:MAG TPA: hypothetical protein VKX16_16355 [Chloroflexota bacterium]|nr:hypothetical protein [Chloroflexota bacterium]